MNAAMKEQHFSRINDERARRVYDYLCASCELRDGVYYDAMSASIRHRASDSKRLDGLNPHMAIFDEIHEFRDYKLINIIKRKNVKRRQPLILYITTMGYVTDGPLADYYGLFSDVLIPGKIKPEVADRLFSYIAELDARDDIEDTSCWVKANPGLGVVLHLSLIHI